MEYALTKRYALRLNLFFSIHGFTKRHGSEKFKHTPCTPPFTYLFMNFYAIYNYNWYEHFDVKLSYKYL